MGLRIDGRRALCRCICPPVRLTRLGCDRTRFSSSHPKRRDVTVAEIDLPVGGRWRCVMVTDDGLELDFHSFVGRP
jgi:hypothetical protein